MSFLLWPQPFCAPFSAFRGGENLRRFMYLSFLFTLAKFPAYLNFYFLAVIFSAISYGIVLVISRNCFHLLLKKRNIYSNRMRIVLLIYVIVMLLSSTWKQIGSIYLLMNLHLTSKYTSLLLYRSFGVPITVITWEADGFMVSILIICQEQGFIM